MSHNTNQKAVILYLAVVITSIMLAIALGVSTILFGQIKTIKEMGLSVKAFYAADTGVEDMLYKLIKENDYSSPPYSGILGDSTYTVIIETGEEPTCPADNYCIRSYGEYQGVRRAIEIGF